MWGNEQITAGTEEQLKLGLITGFSAGMVNVVSVIAFFSFTSNITGHYAILAEEISKGNWYQAAVVLVWIGAFFGGNFCSSMFLTHMARTHSYLAHIIILITEMLILVAVGIYGHFFYSETLSETEVLATLLLFAMGLQNGFTAGISNFSIKTTHLTGLTTDLGVLLAMFTRREHRENEELRNKAMILLIVGAAYISGGISAGLLYTKWQFLVFVFAGILICSRAVYYALRLRVWRAVSRRRAVDLC